LIDTFENHCRQKQFNRKVNEIHPIDPNPIQIQILINSTFPPLKNQKQKVTNPNL
jgi:hypothetical protein